MKLKRSRGLRTAALVASLLLLPLQALAASSADDTARLLAGMPVPAASPLLPLTRESSWQRHAKRFDNAWAALEKRQLGKIRAWSGQHIVQPRPVVYYMFSGPDFLYADAFYPEAATYVLSGLEPVGPVPDVEGLSRGALAADVARLQHSLNSVLSYSFFITKKMKRELRGGRLSGTLPILYVFLARAGKTIEEVRLVTLDDEGVLHEVGEKDAEKGAGRAQGVRITFSAPNGKKQTLYYFSTDLSDGGVERSGFLQFCAGLGHGDSLLKSASYLMHSDNFSKVRDFVLESSDAIVQDDSGIPVRHFKTDSWELHPFGNYLGPISIFPRTYQPQLRALYRRERAGPLEFGIGYRWRPRQSNLLLAVRGARVTVQEQ